MIYIKLHKNLKKNTNIKFNFWGLLGFKNLKPSVFRIFLADD